MPDSENPGIGPGRPPRCGYKQAALETRALNAIVPLITGCLARHAPIRAWPTPGSPAAYGGRRVEARCRSRDHRSVINVIEEVRFLWTRWWKFVPDSPLEESGFEPLVPLATEMLIQWQEGLVMQLGCWRSATSGRCRGCANSEVGPAVRIRFPPAASHLRT
jgi:hypothetical protein